MSTLMIFEWNLRWSMTEHELCCSVWQRSETERASSGEKTGSRCRWKLQCHPRLYLIMVGQASSRVAASQQTLQIFNLQRDDYGVYQCFVARNSSFHYEKDNWDFCIYNCNYTLWKIIWSDQRLCYWILQGGARGAGDSSAEIRRWEAKKIKKNKIKNKKGGEKQNKWK